MIDSSSNGARQRFGGSKVRSGCVTCKRRRVKCGEERPFCSRCVRGKHICEGYASTSHGRRNADGSMIMVLYVPQTVSPSLLPDVSTQAQRSLDFFRARTAIQFAGPFSSELWSQILPRLSHQEDAIRHAIVAVAALHETANQAENVNDEYAIHQYGKAISDVLALDVSNSDAAADTALMSCVLFTAFESMQGHYRSAMTHSSAGLKILREQEAAGRKEAYLPRRAIKSAFMQLDTQSREIGDISLRPIHELPWKTSAPAATFSTVDEAKEWLEDYMRDLTQFMTTLGTKLKTEPGRFEAIAHEHAEKRQLFHAWCLACSDINNKYAFSPDSTPTPSSQGYLILQLWNFTIDLLLKAKLDSGEMGWDVFRYDFRTIISLGERFVENSAILDGTLFPAVHGKLPICKPVHTFSIGIVTPMFLTATRCRDPKLRRRACEIMSACNRSESMWNSNLSARVAERFIALEEAGLGEVRDASQVPVENRILGLDLLFGPDRQGSVKFYQYAPRSEWSNASFKCFEDEFSWDRVPRFSNTIQQSSYTTETTRPAHELTNMYLSSANARSANSSSVSAQSAFQRTAKANSMSSPT